MLYAIEHVESIYREAKNVKQRMVKADKSLEEGNMDINVTNKDKHLQNLRTECERLKDEDSDFRMLSTVTMNTMYL